MFAIPTISGKGNAIFVMELLSLEIWLSYETIGRKIWD